MPVPPPPPPPPPLPPPPPPPGAPPDAEAPFNYSDWQELIASSSPSGADLFSETNQAAALNVHITNAQRRGFLYKVLGYAYADPASPWRLRRVNPVPHPFWGFIFATQAGFTPHNPAGNPLDADGKPKVTYGTTSVNYPVNRWAYYTHCNVTVSFGPLPYAVRDDTQFGTAGYAAESDRHVDWFADVSGEVSIISAETGNALKFIEGPLTTDTPPGPKGAEFKGEIGEQVTRTNFTWMWHDVPSAYILDATARPLKILQGLGKVNLTAFRGHPPGTLLLSGFGLQRFSYPWRVGFEPGFGYDVTFQVSQFDPETAVNPPAFRGHNLQPWAATKAANGSIWYAATRGGNTGDPRYLQSTEFSRLFTHVGDPA